MRFAIVNEASSASPLFSQLTPDWLGQLATALTVQLNSHLAAWWGGSYSVRLSDGTDLAADETVMAIVDELPDAPTARAYHDVNGQGLPVAFLALSTCSTLDDVSVGISHEFCETAGDAGCNLYARGGDGYEYARELCDAVEARTYYLNGIALSDFVLPAFFVPNAAGPYTFMASTGAANDVAGPFQTAPGGYQIRDAQGTGETEIQGQVRPQRLAHKQHYSSRTARRGAFGKAAA